ncbi:Putative uncharacterized protein [Moritella viscosa]|uniref:Uncharacterized protein n=1 Tax=Moritella viscosa TaxID=80854 RepID=A0ABY1H9E4_9GAMM|nr:Putative uncharacterized protein [Moritella viscosa]SGY90749.1 Putative uncharacterized protein [Moritella viscosa]SHO01053.1 Putative uncharacterized protein [Moritella viscosa]SHO01356.1 Putative uncharacterized protein [Moritella viscosa]SHO02925.1 Putative uncharacterized protein [Moritella viscosa]
MATLTKRTMLTLRNLGAVAFGVFNQQSMVLLIGGDVSWNVML